MPITDRRPSERSHEVGSVNELEGRQTPDPIRLSEISPARPRSRDWCAKPSVAAFNEFAGQTELLRSTAARNAVSRSMGQRCRIETVIPDRRG